MAKKVNRAVKPTYVVNIDDIERLRDIDVVFALAKQNAGMSLSNLELTAIIDYVVNDTIDRIQPKIFFLCECDCEKKQPWYKRFWKWLRRK